MPDDYIQTVQLLESHLCSQHISKLFDCSSALDANQTIVMCLVEKATSKADLLDFCEALLSLKNTSRLVSIVESLRKGTLVYNVFVCTYKYMYITKICYIHCSPYGCTIYFVYMYTRTHTQCHAHMQTCDTTRMYIAIC